MNRSPDLARLFNPRSVAVVGASDDTGRIGGRVLRNLLAHGYRGSLIPVSRRSVTVQGLPARTSVDDLESPVDLAVLAVNAAQTLDVLKRLLDTGTRNFLSFAAGTDTEAVAALLATQTDAAMVGPNSNGIWSVRDGLIASFGSEADRTEIRDGPIAIVTHSGSLGGAVARRLQDEGVGTRYLVSAGNEAHLSLTDYIDFFLTDPDVRVIGAYIEGVNDGARLKESLHRAVRSGVQVVAFLAGLSRKAREATSSHTGKSMSSPALYRAVLDECGVALVDSVAALTDACRVATAGFGPRVPTVGAVGISGGMLAIIADACEGADLPFATLNDETTGALERELPGFSAAVNPVDLTGAVLEHVDLLPNCARAVARDPSVDALVVGLDNQGYGRVCTGAWISELAAETDKPIALVLWDAPRDRRLDLEHHLLESGVVVVGDPSDTASTLRWMCRADQVGARTGDTVPAEGEAPRFTQEQLESWSGQLEFAAQLGLRTVASVLVTGAEPDRQAISRLTPPLVVKALPNRVQHKTDLGLVTIGLADTDAACDAVRRLRTRLDADVPIVVQEHAHGVEVLLSMSSDADWGPVLTLGAGGVAVELTGDLIFLPAPSPTERVERAVSRARLGTMLRGYRGAPPADIDALLVAAERLQRVYLASDLAEIELNPLVVAPRGRGAYMIDLLTSENEPRASR